MGRSIVYQILGIAGTTAWAVLWLLASPISSAAEDPSTLEDSAAPEGVDGAESSPESALRVPSSPSAPRGSGDPGLESLLQLPSGFRSSRDAPAVAGASEAEWRRRFRKSQLELSEAREALEKTKRELDEVADVGGGSSWNVSPNVGGAGAPQGGEAPLSFKLRQQLKIDRDSVERAERAMRQLRIEADLAGVPAAWREEEASSQSSVRRELPTPE